MLLGQGDANTCQLVNPTLFPETSLGFANIE